MTTAEREEGAVTIAASGRLLEVEHLAVQFVREGGTVYAVNDVSYAVDEGETLAVIGESGSGKTVTARAFMGLLPPYARISGSARFRGVELIGLRDRQILSHLGNDLAMVFQDASRSLDPTMRVGRQIEEAIRVHMTLSKAEVRERAVALLRRVRMPAPEQRYREYPHQLSGGMRQRVMIAIALACDPRLLVADEATTALDVTTQAQIMELLMELQAEFKMGLIVISHDMGLAASYTDRVAVMYGGRVVEEAPTKVLFSDVRMPYTRALLDAVPRSDRPVHAALPAVAGRPPSLTRPLKHCPFAERCPAVRDRCRQELPSLESVSDHRWACFYPIESGGRR